VLSILFSLLVETIYRVADTSCVARPIYTHNTCDDTIIALDKMLIDAVSQQSVVLVMVRILMNKPF
jgi:hypothetical protein